MQAINFCHVVRNSLEGLIRSGRLSKSLGWVAGLFRLKPLVHIDVVTGKPKVIGAAFSKRSAWRKLTNQLNLLQEQNKVKSIAIVHSDTASHADIFAKYIKRKTNLEPLYITEVSSISGIHTDKNSFSIGYINQEIKL